MAGAELLWVGVAVTAVAPGRRRDGPRGEFSLVIAAVATSVGTGALAAEIPAFAVGYVLLMSVVGTTLMRYSDPIVARLAPALGPRWEQGV